MKRAIAVVVVVLAMAGSMAPAFAQQPPPGRPSVPGEPPAMPGRPGPPGGMPMEGMMMCPMMMSMMGRQADPRMMQMHGEMMKAIGDIMMKYGKMPEGSATR